VRCAKVAKENSHTSANHMGFIMKVMCNQCGRVLDLMMSRSFAGEEDKRVKTYHFCSDRHMEEFAQRKGLALSKD